MAAVTPRPLRELLSNVPSASVRGDAHTPVVELCYRSAEAIPGSLFFCVPGDVADGHAFATDAVARGATVLVVDRWLEVGATQVQVLVRSVREAMGPIAAAFHGHPAAALTIVGVTGTNGKTTTTFLLEAIWQHAGIRSGVIGTTGVRVDGRPEPFPRTTPEAPDLQRILADMVRSGVDGVAMEVSSHGLAQHRVVGVRFDCAVFTNLSQDHLDFHGSMEEYFAAKARLFTPAFADRAVVNLDSAEGRVLARSGVPTVTFAIDAQADVRATAVETTPRGIEFTVDGVRIRSALRGLFNVENCLAVLATARVLGIDDAVAAEAISSVEGVPGRVETVEAGQDFLVLVDYAHTPDGLENILRAARGLSAGRVIVVFGCGGDRDRAKRPRMGEAATSNADLAVVTSDNPRSEDPQAIIDEITPGAARGSGRWLVEPDRRSAIRLALEEASTGDVVVIAGKGHEMYQELADRTIAFDDRLVARDELRAMAATP